jgi:formyl-CoA transferase
MFATMGALAALHRVEELGRGQVVDAAIYESVLGVMESVIPEYAIAGFIRERTGSVLPNVAPSNAYPTADGQMVLIAANQDTVFRRLCEAMGRPELAGDARYADHVARGEHQAELDEVIARWTGGITSDRLIEVMNEHSVVVGRIYRAPEMLADPHFAARRSIVHLPHPDFGDFPMQNVFPRFSDTPGEVAWVGPELGAHNEEIYLGLLGMTGAELDGLRADGIV